jgi:hypothetical protein
MNGDLPHAQAVNSGNRSVFSGVLGCVVLLGAAQAGRVGEDGTGAMWIAPELIRSPPAVLECGQEEAETQALELVFETLDLGDEAADLPRLTAAGTRKTVVFDWNATTGELSFNGAVPAPVFTAESVASRNFSLLARNCGSR